MEINSPSDLMSSLQISTINAMLIRNLPRERKERIRKQVQEILANPAVSEEVKQHAWKKIAELEKQAQRLRELLEENNDSVE